MNSLTLNQDEIAAIQQLLTYLISEYDSVENPCFINESTVFAQELPRRVRSFLNDFRLNEIGGVGMISGYPIDQKQIGKTPTHWKNTSAITSTLEQELLLVLTGALLGDIFGWSTQQDGRIMHNVFPIKGHEQEQLGSGSEMNLEWHTEDAFHPYRGDYVGLMCLRNPDQVPTTFASRDMISVDEEVKQILLQPRFCIRPDESHLEKNKGGIDVSDDIARLLEAAYQRINQMNRNPQKRPVLFGAVASPYICLDPYFMDRQPDDPEAWAALERFAAAVEASLVDICLAPGDICFIDNLCSVHGRKPFKARYDGNDRWLKRINITRDLRRSRDARRSSSARVIY
jgi:Fe(II)/alpha-ketoglutarate-dependent arginine beta-hydroxylase